MSLDSKRLQGLARPEKGGRLASLPLCVRCCSGGCTEKEEAGGPAAGGGGVAEPELRPPCVSGRRSPSCPRQGPRVKQRPKLDWECAPYTRGGDRRLGKLPLRNGSLGGHLGTPTASVGARVAWGALRVAPCIPHPRGPQSAPRLV